VTKDIPDEWLTGDEGVDEEKFLPYVQPLVGELPETAYLEGLGVPKARRAQQAG
jgi:hypothetical protein